jgi:DHA2 family multidrug resistance protein
VVDLRLFRERTYATGVGLITAMGFGLYASLVLMPVLLQTLMRYPALQAGYVMAPRGLGSLVVMPLVGVAIEKTDPRRIIAVGFAVNALTMYWLGTLNLNAGFWDFFWPQFIQGAGMGLLFVPLTTVAMDRIRPEAMGAATSLFNLLRNIGGSVGIATIQTLLARYRQAHGHIMVEHVDPYSPASQILFDRLRSSFVAAGADLATATQRAYAALYGMVQQQAAMLSFIDGFKLLALVFLVLVPFVALMKKPQHHRDA